MSLVRSGELRDDLILFDLVVEARKAQLVLHARLRSNLAYLSSYRSVGCEDVVRYKPSQLGSLLSVLLIARRLVRPRRIGVHPQHFSCPYIWFSI